jgi:hypothetical protein
VGGLVYLLTAPPVPPVKKGDQLPPDELPLPGSGSDDAITTDRPTGEAIAVAPSKDRPLG